MKKLSFLQVLLLFSSFTCLINAFNLNFKETIDLNDYFVNCPNSYPNTFAESTNGDYVIGSNCIDFAQSWLLGIGSDYSMKFNNTYPLYSYQVPLWQTIWPSTDAVYTCGTGSEAYNTTLRVDSSFWNGTEIWNVTPDSTAYPANETKEFKCYMNTDSLLYVSTIANKSTIGLLSKADGSIIKSETISFPNDHFISAALQVADMTYFATGTAWITDANHNSVPKVFLATYDLSLNQVVNITYYDPSPSPRLSLYELLPDVTLFTFGTYYTLAYTVLTNLGYTNVLLKLNSDWTVESSRGVLTWSNAYYSVASIGDYIAMFYYEPISGLPALALIDNDLATVKEFDFPNSDTLGFYYPLPIFKHPTKDAVVVPFGIKGGVHIFWLDNLVTCPNGNAYDESGTCLPCDITCYTCAKPGDSQSCTSCIVGLVPYDPSTISYNCTVYGTADDKVKCIRDFVTYTVPQLELSGWFKDETAGFSINFKQNVRSCSHADFAGKLISANESSIDISDKIWRSNSTSISVLLPTKIVDSYCNLTTKAAVKTALCNILINMIDGPSNSTAVAFRINFQINTNLESQVVTSRVAVGSYDFYDSNSSTNKSVSIPVEPRICSDLNCTSYGAKPTYNKNDEIAILHLPGLSTGKIDSVSDIEVTFTSNGTTVHAMYYLISQESKTDGSLLTKIKLIDASTKPIILTFYLLIQFAPSNSRRLLVDSGYSNISKSSYTFTVVDTESNSDVITCNDASFECHKTIWIVVIVCGSAFALLIATFVVYYICKKRRRVLSEEQADVGKSVAATAAKMTEPDEANTKNITLELH